MDTESFPDNGLFRLQSFCDSCRRFRSPIAKRPTTTPLSPCDPALRRGSSLPDGLAPGASKTTSVRHRGNVCNRSDCHLGKAAKVDGFVSLRFRCFCKKIKVGQTVGTDSSTVTLESSHFNHLTPRLTKATKCEPFTCSIKPDTTYPDACTGVALQTSSISIF